MAGRLPDSAIEQFQRDGAVVLRGLFTDCIERLRRGADANSARPSHRVLTHGQPGHRFLEDFYSWLRIPEYEDVVRHSGMGRWAAELMGSDSAQFFHDHYLDKAVRSDVPTPWHQDRPYYFVSGEQTVSFWIPLEPRPRELSLRCVAGSHRWGREIRPQSWSTLESFYDDDEAFMDLPDIDGGEYDILSWGVSPGDAVAFDFRTVHGAAANTSDAVSRTISFRWVGDDVRYRERPGRTSPSFPDIGQRTGERLREDWFPVLFRAG
jgi:ectoine hydroxylase-related dioxygenase (phytanoyl-CoA dioxygenase family)